MPTRRRELCAQAKRGKTKPKKIKIKKIAKKLKIKLAACVTHKLFIYWEAHRK